MEKKARTSPNGSTPTSSRHPQGGIGLLRDLHDLFLMATEVDISWVVLGQAAQGLQDKELLDTVVQDCDAETGIQLKWIKTRMKQSAPQALIAAS